MKNIIIFSVIFVLLCISVRADWTPTSNINLRETYDIRNATNISTRELCLNDDCVVGFGGIVGDYALNSSLSQYAINSTADIESLNITIPWYQLKDYPGACSIGTFMIQIGDSIVCASAVLNYSDIALTNQSNTFAGNNVFNGNLTVGSNLLFVNPTTGNVGIGVADSTARLDIRNSNNNVLTLNISSTLFFNESTKRIGISTTDPVMPLDIRGDMNIMAGKYIYGSYNTATTNSGYIEVYNPADASMNLVTRNGDAPIVFKTANIERVRIRGAGIGIGGSTTPDAMLTIYNTSALTGGYLNISSKGVPNSYIYVDGRGYVGIGSNAPTSKLNVAGNVYLTNQVSATTRLYYSSSQYNDIYGQISHVGDIIGKGGFKIEAIGGAQYSQGSGNIIFATTTTSGTTTTTKMTINYDGKVGIGTTSPSELLDLYNTSALTGGYLNITSKGVGTPFVYVTGAGRVGIGTDIPSNKLDVRGDLNISGAIYYNNGTLVSAGGSSDAISSPWTYANTEVKLNNSFVSMNVSNTLFVNGTTGRVGINTATPSQALTIGSNGQIYFVGVGALSSSEGVINFANQYNAFNGISGPSATEKISIFSYGTGLLNGFFKTQQTGDNSGIFNWMGKTGIGTATPNAQLEIANANNTNGLSMNISNVLYVNSTSGNVGIGTIEPTARFEIGSTPTNGLAMNVSGVVYVNKTSGRVGINQASPAYSLHLGANSYIYGDNNLYISSSNMIQFPYYVSFAYGISGPVDEILNIRSINSGVVNGYFKSAEADDGTGVFNWKGKIGLGTTTPKARLEISQNKNTLTDYDLNVSGTLLVNSTAGRVILRGKGSDGVSDVLTIQSNNGNRVAWIDDYGRFYSAQSEGFYISGYGTGVSGTTISIYNKANWVGTSTGNLTLRGTTEYDLQNTLYLNTTAKNVGIGTNAPTSKLHIIGDVNATGLSADQFCIGANCITSWDSSGSYNETYEAWAYNQSAESLAWVIAQGYGSGAGMSSTDINVTGYITSIALNQSYALNETFTQYDDWNKNQTQEAVDWVEDQGYATSVSGYDDTSINATIQAVSESNTTTYDYAVNHKMNYANLIMNNQTSIGNLILVGTANITGGAGKEGLIVNANGQVGIGVVPDVALHVKSMVDGYTEVKLDGRGVGGDQWTIGTGYSGDGLNISSFYWYNNDVPTAGVKMAMTPLGKVGIGVAEPTSKLNVDGDINATGISVSQICLGTDCRTYLPLNSSFSQYEYSAGSNLTLTGKSFALNVASVTEWLDQVYQKIVSGIITSTGINQTGYMTSGQLNTSGYITTNGINITGYMTSTALNNSYTLNTSLSQYLGRAEGQALAVSNTTTYDYAVNHEMNYTNIAMLNQSEIFIEDVYFSKNVTITQCLNFTKGGGICHNSTGITIG